jgi:hypothetical protein
MTAKVPGAASTLLESHQSALGAEFPSSNDPEQLLSFVSRTMPRRFRKLD